MKKVIILKKIQVTLKTFAPTFFSHFSLSLNRKKRVVMRAMRKKLNMLTLHLSIYCVLEKEIGANADTVKRSEGNRLSLLQGVQDKSKISFCCPRGSRASPQTYHEQGGVI